MYVLGKVDEELEVGQFGQQLLVACFQPPGLVWFRPCCALVCVLLL